MKKIDFQKSTDLFKNAATKTKEAGKTAVSSVKEKMQQLSDQTQIRNYEARLKKYNPLFPEQYTDNAFRLPNLIMIVDDAVRKNIDVCEGSIGWLSQEKTIEVFHLYDEAIAFSNLQFVPTPVCDSIYYVDPHDRTRFISIDSYFANMQEEKLAELQHIAFCLGAKKYWVEIIENSREITTINKSALSKIKKISQESSKEYSKNLTTQSKSLAEATFSGGRKPTMPTLCWFANDNNVKNLIAMRCSGENANDITTYTIELSNSNAATMSTSTAVKIDAAVSSLGLKCNFNAKSEEEHSRKMYFKLEF